jgi:hypothetical protein
VSSQQMSAHNYYRKITLGTINLLWVGNYLENGMKSTYPTNF